MRCIAKNIDFQTTILSRFDMIFLVRDEHNEQNDQVRHLHALACLAANHEAELGIVL